LMDSSAAVARRRRVTNPTDTARTVETMHLCTKFLHVCPLITHDGSLTGPSDHVNRDAASCRGAQGGVPARRPTWCQVKPPPDLPSN
jgi:hypothetical protein